MNIDPMRVAVLGQPRIERFSDDGPTHKVAVIHRGGRKPPSPALQGNLV